MNSDQIDENYFDSYAHHSIHEDMLKDRVRTLAYRTAIMKCKALFKGKTVLDIGCGTGILSLFAAQAGAALVIAVDNSSIIEKTRKIIEDNHFADTITLLRGKIEEVVLPVEKVDIIISEWMGYFLLYESMFNSVIYARNKYLADDGLLFPDKATMHLCAIEDGNYKHRKIYFWEDVYGFDMSCMQESALKEPLVDVVDERAVCTNTVIIKEFDLATISLEDLSFEAEFSLKFSENDQAHAFLGYFDCMFTYAEPQILLSTSPFAKPTHWKQVVFYLRKDILAKENTAIRGKIACRPREANRRTLRIEIDYKYDNEDEERLLFNFC